jgi:hypothetical protein
MKPAKTALQINKRTVRAIGIAMALAAVFGASPPRAFAATIHVPGDQLTIQAGIDSAFVGDTVLVADGVYTGDGNRDIDLGGKAVVVKSENGHEFTTIDCEADSLNQHRGFFFGKGEDSTAIVDGFTIRNGYAPTILIPAPVSHGGGIYVENSSPTIRNCVLDSNCAFSSGGGLYCGENTSPKLVGCRISGNDSPSGGGAVFQNCSATVVDCLFEENSAYQSAGMMITGAQAPKLTACRIERNNAQFGVGGLQITGCSPILTNCTIHRNGADFIAGVSMYASYTEFIDCSLTRNTAYWGVGAIECGMADPSFEGCTISRNTAVQRGSAGFSLVGSRPIFTRCIISSNSSAGLDTSLSADSESVVTLSCCDVYGNSGGNWVGALEGQDTMNGNFSADPLFCDIGGDDFTIYDNSPCAPANNSCGVLIGANDIGCYATGVAEPDEPPTPERFLSRNHPNPFNAVTVIEYTIPRRTRVEICIYNMLGQKIRTVIDGTKSAGKHSVHWDACDTGGKTVTSGVYLYRIKTDMFVETKKMVLAK